MARRKQTDDETIYTEPSTTEAVPGEGPPSGDGEWQAGYEPVEPITAGTHQRHKWKGGDTCVVCGAHRKTRTPRAPRAVAATKIGNVETIASLLWLGLGVGVEYQPVVGRKPFRNQKDNPEAVPVAVAIGRSLQMESAIAGRRIDRALRSNPLIYGIINLFLSHPTAKWAVELGPLLVPPLIVLAAGMLPEQAFDRLRGVMMTALIPVVVEQAKLIQQQTELMSKMEGMSEDNINMAANMIDALLGKNGSAPDAGSATSS
jgi:hypothetical protein